MSVRESPDHTNNPFFVAWKHVILLNIMADAKRAEIENALEIEVQKVDKMYMRKIQKSMFECAAKCCDTSTASAREVQFCVDKCNEKLAESHKFVSTEINNYQNRLQRCVSQCNDEARDQLGASPTEAEVEKVSKYFEVCACKCIDKHIEILPQFMSKVHEVMGKKVASLTNKDILKP